MNLFMSGPGYGHPGPEVESLNALLRCELAAVEAYTRAVDRFAGHHGRDGLSRILHEHEAAANVLRDHIHNLGGEPDDRFGADEAFAPPALAEADPEALLGALQQAEERGLRNYEAFLLAEEMPQESRFAIRGGLVPRCHEHIDALTGLVAGRTPKG